MKLVWSWKSGASDLVYDSPEQFPGAPFLVISNESNSHSRDASPSMKLLQDIHVHTWYLLRRKTRNYRNRAASDAFAAALSKLGPHDTCIDCGANVGGITRRLAATGALVHAFEPNPDAFQILHREMQSHPNVVLHSAAVGKSNGQVKLFRGNHPVSGSRVWGGATTIAGKTNIHTDDNVMVEQIDFAAFLRALDKPVALIKIDIEGGELELLNHLLETGLHTRAGNIFVETHEKQFPR